MMHKFSSTLAALFFLAKTALAQPAPACPPNVAPADNCAGACVFCNLSDLFGNTAGFTAGMVPNFCGTIENEQWIGFVPSTNYVNFSVTPSGCQNNDGLQIAIFDGCGGQLLVCNVGCGSCGTAEKSVSYSNFTIGKTYFLVVDGYAGDICYFQLNVTPPGALLPPALLPTSAIMGADTVCKNGIAQFCVENQPGASAYQWIIPPTANIDGISGPVVWLAAPDGNCANVQFSTTGGPIKCTPANSCSTGFQKSKPVFVDNTPPVPTILPGDTICFSQIPAYKLPWGAPVLPVADTTVLYKTALFSTKNCDSLVEKTVTVLPNLLKFDPPDSISPKSPAIVLTAPDTLFCKDFVWKNEAGDTVSLSKNLSVSEPGIYCLTAECEILGFVCREESCIFIPEKAVVATAFFEKNGPQIRPNPADDFVEIEFARPIFEDVFLTIFDLNGRLLFSKKIASGLSKIRLETGGFLTGIYVLNLQNQSGVFTRKLVITR